MARQDSLWFDTQMFSKWQDWCAQVTFLCLFLWLEQVQKYLHITPLERWMQGHNAGHTATEAFFYYIRSVFWLGICRAAPETHCPLFQTLGHGSLCPAMLISHGYPLWPPYCGIRCAWTVISFLKLHWQSAGQTAPAPCSDWKHEFDTQISHCLF